MNQANAETLFRAAEIFEELGDLRAAFRCLSVAAGLGHSGSQIQLGNMYASGRGTKKDLKLATKWYLRAFRGGDASAAFNLAIDRRNSGDRKAAISWFRKAAARNHGGAIVELAKLYMEGNATRKHVADLLERALHLGSDDISDNEREEARSLLVASTNNPAPRK
jgi:TPR repeat protein